MPPKKDSKVGKVVELDLFDLKQVKPGTVSLLVAKRNSGKSVLIRNLLYRMRKVHLCIIFSETDVVTRDFAKIMADPNNVINGFSESVMEQIHSRQYMLAAENEKAKEKGRPQISSEVVVVFDDIMASAATIFKTEAIRQLFFQGRHISETSIVATQHLKLIPLGCRQNVDFIFIFKLLNLDIAKSIYTEYCATVFETFQDFIATMQFYTDNYGVVVINAAANSSNIKDVVYRFKARIDLPPFKIGDAPPSR